MAFQEIIAHKRDGYELTGEEIQEFISGYISGRIPDYQASALLMAICLRGMSISETVVLTEAMLKSGKVLDLSSIKGPKIDKHSTGGVGDKVSLMLAPMAAACGLVVPMVSGRGLGHTGGTLDKLESIPGYKTDLGTNKFKSVLRKCGCSIIGQTSSIAPADKRIYALRDVTATVESIPLITASILSKKLASGTDGIVFDIKCGNGAFMKSPDDAEALANSLVRTARKFGKKCRAAITSMDQPLGKAIGNSLEVLEAVDYLRGNRPADLDEIVLSLGAEMLLIGGVTNSVASATRMLDGSISNGAALKKFAMMVGLHGGKSDVFEDASVLDLAPSRDSFRASRKGYISAIDTLNVGLAANALGAGRQRIEDDVDFGVGFVFHRKLGDQVLAGGVIADIYALHELDINLAQTKLLNSIRISSKRPIVPDLIKKMIR
ncbi:MAG: thymidine phosphorylase [candidate division Zixibacteria bacterium CG_4_9_14_3_um_filter_46_8]|nr:MAG: thymidine phosphorylase [candidate division Zixibacteria bacterium CG_4_9_14_3_um_filter_46_8]